MEKISQSTYLSEWIPTKTVCTTNCWHQILRTCTVVNDPVFFGKFLDKVVKSIPQEFISVFGLGGYRGFGTTFSPIFSQSKLKRVSHRVFKPSTNLDVFGNILRVLRKLSFPCLWRRLQNPLNFLFHHLQVKEHIFREVLRSAMKFRQHMRLLLMRIFSL